MTYSLQSTGSFISPQERLCLVRYCATISGDSQAAEDLTQETLLEAWRHLEGLRDMENRLQWFFGIARNVCLRWGRQRGRDLSRYVPLADTVEPTQTIPEDRFTDPFDIEVELERKELIALLDRALAALPAETRVALVKHYVDESPLAEIAAQLDSNPSAVAMRLQRGKLALRRVLTTDMQAELAAYNPLLSQQHAWESTRLWCIRCGRQHLQGWLDPDAGSLALKCPDCCRYEQTIICQTRNISLLSGVKGYKRALSRIASWDQRYFQTHLPTGTAPCPGCGKTTPIQRTAPGDILRWHSYDNRDYRLCGDEQHYGLSVICPDCESSCITLSDDVISWLPEAQQFLRDHPHACTLPDHEIKVNGQRACVISLQSITDNAHLDITMALDTFTVLQVYGGAQ